MDPRLKASRITKEESKEVMPKVWKDEQTGEPGHVAKS